MFILYKTYLMKNSILRKTSIIKVRQALVLSENGPLFNSGSFNTPFLSGRFKPTAPEPLTSTGHKIASHHPCQAVFNPVCDFFLRLPFYVN